MKCKKKTYLFKFCNSYGNKFVTYFIFEKNNLIESGITDLMPCFSNNIDEYEVFLKSAFEHDADKILVIERLDKLKPTTFICK